MRRRSGCVESDAALIDVEADIVGDEAAAEDIIDVEGIEIAPVRKRPEAELVAVGPDIFHAGIRRFLIAVHIERVVLRNDAVAGLERLARAGGPGVVRPFGAGRNQAAEVDHVGIALAAVVAAEVLRGIDGAADRREVGLVVGSVIEVLGIGLEGGGERADLAQIHQSERGVTLLLVCGAVFIEAVADRLAQCERVGGGPPAASFAAESAALSYRGILYAQYALTR